MSLRMTQRMFWQETILYLCSICYVCTVDLLSLFLHENSYGNSFVAETACGDKFLALEQNLLILPT